MSGFDPADIEGLAYWDDVGTTHGWWPPSLREREITNRNSADLAQYILDLRNALLLPLSEAFMGGIRAVLDVAEQEARRRVRKPVQTRGVIWADFDLLGAVTALCGPGRAYRDEYWFRCPFHEERTASFHVNPGKRIYHCFGCGRQGGVREWLNSVT